MNEILELLIRKYITKSKKKKYFKNLDENEKLKFKVEKQTTDIRKYSLEYIRKLENINNLIEFELKTAHWIAFKNVTDRKNFLSKISTKNFEKVSMITEHKANFSYRLEIMKKSMIDEQSITNFSKLISKIAVEKNGIYESWEIVEIDELERLSTIKEVCYEAQLQ